MPHTAQGARDLRVRKTYAALFRAFRELITTQPFDKITVTELCNRAMIRTATFYKHFQDKYEFAQFMMQTIRAEYAERAEHTQHSEPADTVEYCVNLVREGFSFLEDNESLIRAIDSNGLLVGMMHSAGEQLQESIRARLLAEGTFDREDAELLAEMFVGAMNQIARWWFANRGTYSKNEVIARLTDLLRGMTRGLSSRAQPAGE